MSKGKGIGIFVAVIAVAIVVGIASLPDEVLLDTPELDTSNNSPSEIIPANAPIIEEVVEEPVEEVVEEPVEEVVEEPVEEVVEEPDDSDGELIEIKIKDGVGGGER